MKISERQRDSQDSIELQLGLNGDLKDLKHQYQQKPSENYSQVPSLQTLKQLEAVSFSDI